MLGLRQQSAESLVLASLATANTTTVFCLSLFETELSRRSTTTPIGLDRDKT
jgi:hypothetical protein